MNLIEYWFAAILQDQIQRGTHGITKEPGAAVKEQLDLHNEDSRSFIWTKSADEILESVQSYCERINDVLH